MIQTIQAPLMLADELRLEGAFPVVGDVHDQAARLGVHCLMREAVTGVGAPAWLVPLMPEAVGHLGFKQSAS